MGLGREEKQAARRVYLSVIRGKIAMGTGEGRQLFTYIDGTLSAIYKKNSTFGNETVTRWYIDLRDGGELYSLCFPYSSGVFKSIILALASDENLTAATPIRIEPYEGRNGYTKVKVYSEGVLLDWITATLPEQETVTIGGRTVRDDSKRMEFITSLVNRITARITLK